MSSIGSDCKHFKSSLQTYNYSYQVSKHNKRQTLKVQIMSKIQWPHGELGVYKELCKFFFLKNNYLCLSDNQRRFAAPTVNNENNSFSSVDFNSSNFSKKNKTKKQRFPTLFSFLPPNFLSQTVNHQ